MTEPLLVSIPEILKLLSIGKSRFYESVSSGEFGPQPVKAFGKKRLYKLVDIQYWVLRDCPTREHWSKISGSLKLKLTKASLKESGWIYFGQIKGHDLYKIGITTQGKKRMRDYMTENPLWKIICYKKIKGMRLLEKTIKDMYRGKRIAKSHEWLKLTQMDKDVIINMINTAIS